MQQSINQVNSVSFLISEEYQDALSVCQILLDYLRSNVVERGYEICPKYLQHLLRPCQKKGNWSIVGTIN
jgi:hypothetical protein